MVKLRQFAAILYRYAQQSGADVLVGEDTNILSYADVLDISEYAMPPYLPCSGRAAWA